MAIIDQIRARIALVSDTPVSMLRISDRGRMADLRAFGAVYCIGAAQGENVKIGWSRNPVGRVAQLQVAQADTMSLLAWFPGSLRDEWVMHQTFDELHIRGEWFFNQDNYIVTTMAAILERHWPVAVAA